MSLYARAWWVAGLLAASCVFGLAQEAEDPALSGMSRQLRMGIRFYEKGEDLEAMDRFMDVVTKGDPAERSMANEYINLISHRMNTGEKGPAPERPSSLRPTEAVVEAAPGSSGADPARLASVARPVTSAPAPPPRRAAPSAMAPANKELMKREIRAKLRAALDQGLTVLRGVEGVRLLMMSNGEPQAVAIPSGLLFQQGISFQPQAGKILEALTKVVYSVGGAQAVILPEGTAVGDAKVLDMRRTMGISAHLFSAGVAPPRVRVNLLNTQVDIPKPLQDFKGIVMLFVYNQPLALATENSLGEEAGPPISLGIFPTTIRPEKGEGAVIEFSVQEPPAGLASWKFQLLEPAAGGALDLAPLQEVMGGSPVFHQVYWNGRRNYFGAPLAAGRYEAVLSATDGKNRTRTLHRWLSLDGVGLASRLQERPSTPSKPNPSSVPMPAETRSDVVATAVTLGKTTQPPGAPSADLPGGAAAPLIKVAPRGKQIKKRQPAKAARRVAAKRETAAALQDAPAPEKPTKPSSESHQLDFNKNTHQLTPQAEGRLAEVAELAAQYPMESLKIQGFAQTAEENAAALAERRAKMVAGLLINKYQIDPKKIQVASAVSETAAFKVQISFVKDL